jgi:alpha-L-rhamnosidase
MAWKLILAGLMLGTLGAVSAAGQRVEGWTGLWVQAPWASVRDGAEVDGSRPLPVFRREFTVKGKVQKATLRIAGLGQWEAHLGWANGTFLVGAPGLHQGWTDYRKTVRFESCDVTEAMRPGKMVLGVMLGNGMYNVQRSSLSGEGATGKARYTKFEGSFGPPKLIAELRVEYADGQTQVVGTDGLWQVSRGPVVFDSTYGGEDYDARREQPGWDQPEFESRSGFQDAGWSAVQVVTGPGGALKPAVAPEVVQQQMYAPIATKEVAPGVEVYDLGQTFAGIPRVRVTGPAGAVLRITPGELVNPDGTVTQRSSGGPMWWSYTLRGDGGAETWSPKFDYYGFRYLQVEWTGAAQGKVENVAGIGLHSASQAVGTFASSNEWLNRIHALIVAAMHNNEVSLLTDCPHREKLGWLEQTHLVAEGLMFNNDLRGLYRATDANIADAQQADGMVPTIAPQYTKFGPKYAIYDDSPEWGSAAVLAPWAAYRFYGDRNQLALDYPVMQRYVAYLAGRAVDGIVAYGLGDWYDIGPGGPGFEKNTTLGGDGDADVVRGCAGDGTDCGHCGEAGGCGGLSGSGGDDCRGLQPAVLGCGQGMV